MSGVCEFLPNEPGCEQPTVISGETDDENRQAIEEEEAEGGMMDQRLLEAQLTFLLTSLSFTVSSALQ